MIQQLYDDMTELFTKIRRTDSKTTKSTEEIMNDYYAKYGNEKVNPKPKSRFIEGFEGLDSFGLS